MQNVRHLSVESLKSRIQRSERRHRIQRLQIHAFGTKRPGFLAYEAKHIFHLGAAPLADAIIVHLNDLCHVHFRPDAVVSDSGTQCHLDWTLLQIL